MMLKEKVFKIVSQVMNVPFKEVNERSSSDNLGRWDSLQHINLILALEEEFKIKFTAEEIAQMGNVSIILDILQNKVTS
ncbi:acyl carrier protein [Candidatus Omnitrophota bacterium]